MKVIKKSKSRYSKVKQINLTSPLVTRILFGLVVLLVLTLLGFNIKLLLFLVISIVFNALLANFQLKRGLPTDFELSTFSTVMVTLAFDLRWGIIIAIFSKLIASLYTGNVLADHFFMILTYINAAVLAFLFIGLNPFLIGMIIVVINTILMFLISKNILGLDITSNLSYTGTNFIFNFLVFSIFSQVVYNILS